MWRICFRCFFLNCAHRLLLLMLLHCETLAGGGERVAELRNDDNRETFLPIVGGCDLGKLGCRGLSRYFMLMYSV